MFKEFIRNKLLENFTGNLGYVIETPSKIICMVDINKILRNQNKDHLIIQFYLEGIEEKNKDIAKEYGMDKPIMYVIDSLVLDNNYLYIKANNCDVLIGSSYLVKTTSVECNNGYLFVVNSKISGHYVNMFANNLIMDRSIIEGDDVKLIVNDKLDLTESLVDGKNVFTNYNGEFITKDAKIKAKMYMTVDEIGKTRKKMVNN